MVSLTPWSPTPHLRVYNVLDWTDQRMADQWLVSQLVQNCFKWYGTFLLLYRECFNLEWGCVVATRCWLVWGQFNGNMSILAPSSFTICRGKVSILSVRRACSTKPGCQPHSSSYLYHLQRNDQDLTPWVCGVTTKTKSIHKNPWRRCILTVLKRCHAPADSSSLTKLDVAMIAEKSRNLIPQEAGAVVAQRKCDQIIQFL